MGFFKMLFDSFVNKEQNPSGYNKQISTRIRCADCGSSDLEREGMEIIHCCSCGRQYSMEEARKVMGTNFCRDCIYHTINLYEDGIMEHCFIWGLNKCQSGCNRKETKPTYRWTDANRWEKD